MSGLARHGRHERDRRRAAPDDDDALAGVVEVRRPVLRMADPAGEALGAGETGRVALVIAVVAGVGEEKIAGHVLLVPGVGTIDLDRPAQARRRPVSPHNAAVVADPRVDPVVAGSLTDVPEDRRTIRDRLVVLPGPEPVAEGEHVRVRADPRVAEQVPGPPARIPRLEDREALRRALGSQVARRADAGEPGPDDEHVEMFHRRLGLGGHRLAVLSCPRRPATPPARTEPAFGSWYRRAAPLRPEAGTRDRLDGAPLDPVSCR